jgi:predicted transposase/invertase (TIGR01784 family)
LIKGSDKYHHHFGLYDIENKILLTDLLEIHTLEIPKARKIFDGTEDTRLLDWMKFLDVKTEEELNMLAQKSPVMKKATIRLLELSADEKARQLYEARLKEQRDIYAREQGVIFTVAKNLLRRNRPINEIVEDTGLTLDELETLRNEL